MKIKMLYQIHLKIICFDPIFLLWILSIPMKNMKMQLLDFDTELLNIVQELQTPFEQKNYDLPIMIQIQMTKILIILQKWLLNI
jgi:hypothetical protein